MIRIHEALKKGEAEGRILLQVHDELVFEVPEESIEALQDLVVREMEGAMSLKVPLRVEVGRGKSWYDCKG
jgi:DNA polymerase-1